MKNLSDWHNKVLCGDAIEVMRARIPDDSIDLVVTSPPYWGLRDYGAETVRVWDGSSKCEHEWGAEETKKITSQTAYELGRAQEGGYGAPSNKLLDFKNKSVSQGNFCLKCGAWRGSLGLEPHPQLFIDHLVEICREIKRVLKPSGTFFLNLGDTYYGGAISRETGRHDTNDPTSTNFGGWGNWDGGIHKVKLVKDKDPWLQPKQKLMMPSRIAIALQHDGWILRSDIIWHKPNHMPSPVKDRLTNAYEHVFLFAKQRRYYFDLDAIRKPHATAALERYEREKSKNLRSVNLDNKWLESDEKDSMKGLHGKSYADMKYYENLLGKNPGDLWDVEEEKLTKHDIAVGRIGNFSYTDPLHTKEYHPQGKNPGDLWRIPTAPFPGAHFATFPRKLIEPIIKAGSPRWVCSQCGKPRTRIIETESMPTRPAFKSKFGDPEEDLRGPVARERRVAAHQTVGWSDCGCGKDWEPGIVLDPFGGSGTVGKVARKLGRRFILIEIIPGYCDMAEQRVRGRYKPIPDGVVQLTLFMDYEK